LTQIIKREHKYSKNELRVKAYAAAAQGFRAPIFDVIGKLQAAEIAQDREISESCIVCAKNEMKLMLSSVKDIEDNVHLKAGHLPITF
jgi:hypothetical protein